MLSKSDVQWIKDNRDETTKNRTVDVSLIGSTQDGKHPVTGESVWEEFEKDTIALVTEIESAFKTDVGLDEGVLVENGDLWVTVDIDDYVIDGERLDYRKVERVGYDGDKYSILAADKGGIGVPNRVIMVARRDN